MDDTLAKKQQDMSMDSAVLSTHESLECAICFLYLRDPVLTRCGHRFCSKCISKWLSAHENCPIDNTPLTETDIFPDNYTKRVIANISIICQNDGCSASIPVMEFEEHYANCQHQQDKLKQDNNECECPYNSVNCDYKTNLSSELLAHIKHNVLKHMQLLLKESKRLGSSFQNCRNQCMHNEGCFENEDHVQCFKGKLPFYLNDVYVKLTELDQLSKENTIKLSNVTAHLEKYLTEMNYAKPFVWEICNFDEIKSQIQSGLHYESFSPKFSSSEIGYRFQLRLLSSDENPDGLALLIYVVKGIYDPILKWPFYGKIIFRVLNQIDPNMTLEMSIDVKKNQKAFERAKTTDINLLGFGFKKRLTVSDLERRRFVYDNKLVIVVTVKSFYDNDFIINLKSENDQVHFRRRSE